MRDAEKNRSQLKRGSWIRALLLFGAAVAQAQQVQVPQELEGWRGWALQGAEYRRCPFLVSRSATDANSYRCAWPERLELALDAHGGRFSQGWQVYATSWVVLPGDADHWPLDLEANGAPLAAVLRDGVPQARLDAGHYAISGRFGWTQRPEQLAVAQQTALVDLTLDGQRIAQPERPNGAVWLGKRRTAESARGLDLQVYRLRRGRDPGPAHHARAAAGVGRGARGSAGRAAACRLHAAAPHERARRAPRCRRQAARAGASGKLPSRARRARPRRGGDDRAA